jgi:NAD(P)H-dependent flavin oxidoreductase YrpB (nitropropane dioxygenase family)
MRLMRTRITDLLGCRLPLQLAPLGGVGTLELARAVARAGGFGMVPMGVELPEDETEPIGRGVLIPYLRGREPIADLARGARVVEFFWGEPDAALVESGRSTGCLVGWQVGSAAEAVAAQRAGCDYVAAQGVEAGGHVRGTVVLDELLAEVRSAVTIPVIAAGGIGTAERVRDLLRSGADGVRVGSRFLAAAEADVHPEYLAGLIEATAADTVLTEFFDDGGSWPAPVRVLRRSLEQAERAGNRSTMPAAGWAEQPEIMPWYAGMSVDHVRTTQPAAEIVGELTSLLDVSTISHSERRLREGP